MARARYVRGHRQPWRSRPKNVRYRFGLGCWEVRYAAGCVLGAAAACARGWAVVEAEGGRDSGAGGQES